MVKSSGRLGGEADGKHKRKDRGKDKGKNNYGTQHDHDYEHNSKDKGPLARKGRGYLASTASRISRKTQKGQSCQGIE